MRGFIHPKTLLLTSFLLVVSLVLPLFGASYKTPLVHAISVNERMPFDVEITNPNSYEQTWTIVRPNAIRMRVTFVVIQLEGYPCGDHVYVRNSTHIVNDYIYNYYGLETSRWVGGSTLIIQLVSDGDNVTGAGFHVDSLEFDLGSNNISFQVLDLSGSVLPSADITILGNYFNYRYKGDSKGWTNFTDIPNDKYLVTTRWQGSVVNQTTITFFLVRPQQYIVASKVGFADSFRDSSGNSLYTNPSSFELATPNGTITRPLPVTLPNGTALSYRLQNGTIKWHSVTWQGTDVLSTSSPDFYAEEGSSKVNCKVYSLAIDPVFKDNWGSTLNAQPSSWVVTLPNSTSRTLNAPVAYSQTQGGVYAVTSITWQGMEVVPTTSPKFSLTANSEWTPVVLCRLPTKLGLFLTSSTIDVGSKVNIYGDLKCNNVGLQGASISLAYSTTGGSSWTNIISTKTADGGAFSNEWVSPAIGSYIIRAIWTGNSTYPSSSENINLAVTAASVSSFVQTQLWIIMILCVIIAGILAAFLVRRRTTRL